MDLVTLSLGAATVALFVVCEAARRLVSHG